MVGVEHRAEHRLLRQVWSDPHVPGHRATEPPVLVFGPPRYQLAGDYDISARRITLYERSGELKRENPLNVREEAHCRKLVLLHEIAHAVLHPAEGHTPVFRWLLAWLEHRYGGGYHSWYSYQVCAGRPPKGKEFVRCPRL